MCGNRRFLGILDEPTKLNLSSLSNEDYVLEHWDKVPFGFHLVSKMEIIHPQKKRL